MLARLLRLIRDAHPAHFTWHVRSHAAEKLPAKDSESRVRKPSLRPLGSLKYEIFTGFYKRKYEYITVPEAALECGHTPERIKSSVLSGLNQGQLERVPLDRGYGYRLTAKGLEALENERQRRQSPGIGSQERAREAHSSA
jgi:hypothetical protein